ncbi:hypothetical protein BTW26_02635 [Pediococcus acidilactici]|uniref:glycosyltransferase n=1 Tax=Pediococcus acidilactici TaxID=1254 RepID=UPI0009473367|nr:glycosyltransferase [Pediococcus acidilactici]APR27975.1 hypothetical protein BTW26_02635 [Pediococcus acidilactici]
MKILHYTLGFPPKRSGGLVRYAQDVIEEEANEGHDVSVLYPGKVTVFNKEMRIQTKDATHKINMYELINSLPLAIFGGIKDPKDFMDSSSSQIFEDFFKSIKPDVIHVHTLMGMPKEFFETANKMKITIVYTTHDYYGLAPNPTFFTNGRSYDRDNSNYFWNEASKDALSTNKLRIFQLPIYPIIRTIFKKLKFTRKMTTNKDNKVKNDGLDYEAKVESKKYDAIRKYYKAIFLLIDKFHFNSSIAKEVYEFNLPEIKEKSSEIISITNSNIIVHNKINNTRNRKIKIAYIGPNKEFKGIDFFLKLSQSMDKKKYEFHTYGYVPRNYIKDVVQHGRYAGSELANIYKNIDVLVVPSKWKETFGFIVLEAMANQTKVYVSDNVGAKDLLSDDAIFRSMESLKNSIENTKDFDEKYCVKTIDEHIKELLQFYKK